MHMRGFQYNSVFPLPARFLPTCTDVRPGARRSYATTTFVIVAPGDRGKALSELLGGGEKVLADVASAFLLRGHESTEGTLETVKQPAAQTPRG